MRTTLQIFGAVLGIAGLLALNALALFVIYRVVMMIVKFIPVIGKKHRHSDWERLNRG